MEREFWNERWERNEIGFHQEAVNPRLQQHLHRMQWPPGANVLVPLCGKTLDLWWLRDRGFHVTGVEISPLAVRDFFSEAARVPNIVSRGAFDVYRVERLQIYCGDFFALDRRDLPRVDGVYDRAALVALPPGMRADYVKRISGLVGPGTRTLLITLDYPQREMKGPPFSVPPEEVEERYAVRHRVQRLQSQDCLAAEPRFREKGLSRLDEHVFLIERIPRDSDS